MENAAEALKMAAGMLLALLLIALLVYVFNSISLVEEAKSEAEARKQVADFNKKFSAFDKSIMYGTDVISVIGLAIANNKVANSQRDDSDQVLLHPLGNYSEFAEYSINIKFKIPGTSPENDIRATKVIETYRVTKNADGVPVEEKIGEEPGGDDKLIFRGGAIIDLKKFGLPTDIDEETLYTEYGIYLGDNDIVGSTFGAYKNIEDIALYGDAGKTTDVEVLPSSVGNETIIRRTVEDKYGYGMLKQIIFKCDLVKYNEVGRINYMVFSEKHTNTEEDDE